MHIKKGLFLALALFLIILPVKADINLGQKLAGKILLQIENNGEAWYVNPENYKKYYLNKPSDAFSTMRKLGIGITNDNLSKIPIGVIADIDKDNDNDGLGNRLEETLLTDKDNPDSDNDGHSDYDEIINNYNPIGADKILIDENFVKKNTGKIFLQIEQNGEAWYVSPDNLKRYYLSRPSVAFKIMRKFGLGINNININKISTHIIPNEPNIFPKPDVSDTPVLSTGKYNVIKNAASTIRNNDPDEAIKYFRPDMEIAIRNIFESFNDDSRLVLGNILSGSTLATEIDDKLTYKNNVYFSMGGYSVPVEFYIEKELNGEWYLTNL
ncbi:MAG: hypothetical protein U9Q85_02955 [Patescibacteria group bacterium]|nr:hypothetical protein [Patescibacteria group bacterium]